MPINNTTQNKEELSEEQQMELFTKFETILRNYKDENAINAYQANFRLMDIFSKSLSQAHQSGIEEGKSELLEERKEKALELAEAQLLGFYHGRWNRDDIAGLVFSMGLTKKEWIQLNKKYSMNYLTKADRKEIIESLKENK